MKKYTILQIVLSVSFILMCLPIWANPPYSETNYWQCTTVDAESKTWIIDDNNKSTAINRSLAACKKESAQPKTCKISKDNCEHFVNGQPIQPMWRCVALDRAASFWPSDTYIVRDEAALAALAACKDNSSVPASCYINMITCRNLNTPKAMDE